MGSKTYEFILGHDWAYGDMPALGLTLARPPAVEGATGSASSPGRSPSVHDEMLEAAAGKDVWLVGGGDVASQYVAAGPARPSSR